METKKTTKTTKTTKTITTTGGVEVTGAQAPQMASHQTHNVTITRGGLFFNDAFFEDTRQDFQQAVKDVVSKWGGQTPATDEISCYRNIRSQDLRDENQAVRSSDDQQFHKVTGVAGQ